MASMVVSQKGSMRPGCFKFRDFKKGGYNLEIARLGDRRLVFIILLICLSYSLSTFIEQNIKSKGIAKYVSRPTERERTNRRHSSF